jgi:hypothetical protein
VACQANLSKKRVITFTFLFFAEKAIKKLMKKALIGGEKVLQVIPRAFSSHQKFNLKYRPVIQHKWSIS